MKDVILFESGRFRFSFAWYDLWIGAFVDSSKRKLYLCLIPTLLLTIKF
jgi:hypothetical protein